MLDPESVTSQDASLGILEHLKTWYSGGVLRWPVLLSEYDCPGGVRVNTTGSTNLMYDVYATAESGGKVRILHMWRTRRFILGLGLLMFRGSSCRLLGSS